MRTALQAGWQGIRACGFLFLLWLIIGTSATGLRAQVVAEFNAEAGQITAPLVLRNGAVSQPVTTGLTNAGRAVYTFTVTNAGFFILEAWVQAVATNSNSFFVNIDTEPEETANLWEIPVSLEVTNRIVSLRKNAPSFKDASPAVFKLATGEHKIIVAGCEANTRLTKVSVIQVTKPKPPAIHLLNAAGS